MTTMEIVALSELDELAATANREHGLAIGAAMDAVSHAIRAGEALLAAREQVPMGDWSDWLAANFIATQQTAQRYCRVARHKGAILESEAPTLEDGLALLRHVEPERRHSDATRRRVREVFEAGNSIRATAVIVGISRTAAARILNPEASRRHEIEQGRRREAARKALKREQRAKAAKAVGGDIGEAYSLVRRLADTLDGAAAREGDIEARTAIAKALHSLYRVEDQIVRAIGTSQPRAESRAA